MFNAAPFNTVAFNAAAAAAADTRAVIAITIAPRTGTATAPVAVRITGDGTASAPIVVGIVDSLETTRWSARVRLGGVDVSSRLVGSLSVDAEEGAARVAQWTMAPAAGVITPTTWVGAVVTIDLLRVIGTESVPSRLFTGRVDVPSFDPTTGLVQFFCTDDLQNRVAALSKTEIDDVVGGRYHTGAQGEIDEHWAYAQARMESVAGSLDAGPQGQIRVTAWDGLATWATYTEADILDGSLRLDLPRRTDIVNRVDVSYQYRYYRCRERRAHLSWSKSLFGSQAPASGYQYPTQDQIEACLDGLGWHRLSTAYARAPLQVALASPAGYYVECVGISNMAAWLGQRHAQAVTETHTLTVTAPQSISASGELAVPLRGAYETTWTPDEWESDWTVATPDASAADVDYAGDQTRAESDACIRTLLDMAKVRILAAHRNTRVGFAIACLPELDLDRAVQVDTDALDATGKVARVEHTLDIDSGQATTTVTLALSGVAATGLVTPDDLDPPTPPDVDEATGTDDWEAALPNLQNHVGAASISSGYTDALMGFICNAPATYTATDGTDSTSVENAFFDSAEEYPTVGFRIACPGVADSHRNPLTLESAAAYAIAIPEDPLTLTVS